MIGEKARIPGAPLARDRNPVPCLIDHSKNFPSLIIPDFLSPSLCTPSGSPDTPLLSSPCGTQVFHSFPLYLSHIPRGDFHMFKTLMKDEEILPNSLLWDFPKLSWKIISSVNRVRIPWVEQSTWTPALWNWSSGRLWSPALLICDVETGLQGPWLQEQQDSCMQDPWILKMSSIWV